MPTWRPFGWTWNRLGKTNALGAILNVDGQIAEWNINEFLATGRVDADRFMDDLMRMTPGVPRRSVLDFGCGVGRVTRVLADRFEAVVGADVAPSMIEQAKSLHADCDRCQFILNRAPHLRRFPSCSFDVVYSRIVLQHIQPAIVEGYISEFIRVLKPGGVLMFQLPEMKSVNSRREFEGAPVVGTLKQRLPKPLVRVWRRVKYTYLVRSRAAVIEMFGINRNDVEVVIKRSGGRLLWAKPDSSHGTDGLGFEYWVTKE